jgi:hypothetical protein
VLCRSVTALCSLSRQWSLAWEASPSLVYGAALLMRLGVTPPPGFKSRSLRWDPVRREPGLAC